MNKESAITMARSFVAECKSNGLNFSKVLLFSSAARNEMHRGSDINLLLVSDRFSNNIFENLKLYSRINIR